MITVNDHVLKPTIFPDGTSQIWNLPDEIIKSDVLWVDWRFEEEREIFDLFSLRTLFPQRTMNLYIPYLPYARQDKPPSNDATFNLYTFNRMLELLRFSVLTTVDLHSDVLFRLMNQGRKLIVDKVNKYHVRTAISFEADTIVYPDEGAEKRYWPNGLPVITMKKIRDQTTGRIIGQGIVPLESGYRHRGKRFLIIDDICDGGATFIGAADLIRKKICPDAEIALFVTHGIFSKGRAHLENHGIKLYTTDSLIHNKKFEGVFKV